MSVVVVLLAAGLTQQFRVVGPRGAQLDRFGIVPQWKFFGQSYIATDPAFFDDLCLLARIGPSPDVAGPWQNILAWEDRPIVSAVWNSSRRNRDAIGEAMAQLALTEAADELRAEPMALTYLTVLRHCIQSLPPSEGEALQFAVATTSGRSDRAIHLRFLSDWHTP